MSFNSSPNYGTRTVVSTSILKRLDDLEKTKDPAIREDINELKEKTRSLENSINDVNKLIDDDENNIGISDFSNLKDKSYDIFIYNKNTGKLVKFYICACKHLSGQQSYLVFNDDENYQLTKIEFLPIDDIINEYRFAKIRYKDVSIVGNLFATYIKAKWGE